MARLKENLDLVAILLLIAVLGLGRPPVLQRPVQGIRLEQPEAKFRLHRLDRLTRLDRLARTIPFVR